MQIVKVFSSQQTPKLKKYWWNFILVESKIPTMASKSFEFPFANYEFMVVPAELSSSKSSDFLSMIQ